MIFILIYLKTPQMYLDFIFPPSFYGGVTSKEILAHNIDSFELLSFKSN